MSEKQEHTRTPDADQGPERIDDPPAGLDRLKKTLKRILKVPKSAIENTGDETRRRPRST